MDVQEVGGGRGDWTELAQDRDRWRALVSTVKLVSFSRRTLFHGVSKCLWNRAACGTDNMDKAT
jgi:hypothetical protein